MRLVAVLFFASACCALGACNASVDANPRFDLSGVHPDGFIDFIDMARNTTSCAGGGSVCSSANPGKCDPGIVTCDGTLAMCTPSSTTQDCYDGPMGTAGVGICTSGVQSCIGVLGPCNGQILPKMQEDCSNDADDDCNGSIDNGCPDSVTMGTARYVAPLAPTTPPMNANQTTMEKRCPAGAFVSAIDIRFDDPHLQLAGLRFSCATPSLIKLPGGTTYALASAPVSPAPYDSFIGAGAVPTDPPTTLKCSTAGLAGIVLLKGDYDTGSYVGMFTQCGSASAAIQPDNTLKITVTPVGAMPTGYDYNTQIMGSVTNVTWSCNSNEFVIGFKGVVSDSIDQLQAICAPISPVYKP